MSRFLNSISRADEAISLSAISDLPAPWSENALLRVQLALTKAFGDMLPDVLRTRFQDLDRAREVANIHYDLDPRMYELMLGDTMAYTCAYHPDKSKPFDLDTAQRAKMDLVCRKLDLKPGMRVLDIGCGFGSLAKHMAENYDVNVVGVTISKAQHKYGQKKCEGLPVDLRLQDYREIDDGLFLLHTIGCDTPKSRCNILCDTFIFPGGVIPSRGQISWGVNGNLHMGDLHEFGANYALTLDAWYKNIFSKLRELAEVDAVKYGLKFQIIWALYLQIAKYCFEKPDDDLEKLKLWQFLYSKNPAVKDLPKIR